MYTGKTICISTVIGIAAGAIASGLAVIDDPSHSNLFSITDNNVYNILLGAAAGGVVGLTLSAIIIAMKRFCCDAVELDEDDESSIDSVDGARMKSLMEKLAFEDEIDGVILPNGKAMLFHQGVANTHASLNNQEYDEDYESTPV